ncbi:uncharacterized protein EDB91DRAFT_1054199 [Suillus paluster]|uniref:uncharacterized protein n=1 Tax=Suillus paluster TaxID=48578 RepID=UPI001B85F6D1|nr:uncharacterized protein EDB91DRAFT_1054199 [Suillus paluster]KAG1738884.1 hypothetical protein EDB91DRAFT_1054199 [Suillus paluster]
MTLAENDGCPNCTKRKGEASDKHPGLSEQAPLLLHHSDSDVALSQIRGTDEDAVNSSDARRRILAGLFFCMIISLLLDLLVYFYAASTRLSDVHVLQNALVLQGPYRVSILNITQDGGAWIQLQARVGIDAGPIMSDDDEGIFYDMWKPFGRWGVKLLDRVTVDVESTAQIFSQRQALLAAVDPLSFELPLTVNPPHDDSWLSPMSLTLFVVPTRNASDINQFVHESWHSGAVYIHASIPSVVVSGGSANKGGWRKILRRQRLGIQTNLSTKLPLIPGLPTPGEGVSLPPVSQLITIQSFGVKSEANDVTVHAPATVIDPVPSIIDLTAPSLPFIIFLPGENHSSVPVALVHSDPFKLTHPNITLAISGSLLPLTPHASASISTFINRYLSLEPNPISVACPLFPSFAVDMEFPVPTSKPQILRNVTIRDMKIKKIDSDLFDRPFGLGILDCLLGLNFLASGTMFARMVLPEGIDLALDVTRVFPDVLVFRREVQQKHLPNQLPKGAFGRIRPENGLKATSVRIDAEEGEGSVFAVTAAMVDVPLMVFFGQGMEFRDYLTVCVILFLQGTTDVGVHIFGLPFRNHEDAITGMDLLGLPFQGSVHIAPQDILVKRRA